LRLCEIAGTAVYINSLLPESLRQLLKIGGFNLLFDQGLIAGVCSAKLGLCFSHILTLQHWGKWYR